MTSWGVGGSPQQEPPRSELDGKISRFAEALRGQFRQLANHITRSLRVPARASRQRRRGETGRAFAPARIQLTRRAPQRTISEIGRSFGDALDWLHLWECNGSHEVAEEFDASPTSQDHLSLNL
jgi:hypothetical protein